MTEEQVWKALAEVLDPELGINIVDLGLVYSVEADEGQVHVAMTMTTPACPLHTYLTSAAEAAIWQRVPGVRSIDVRLVWDPPWNPQMMTRAAKLQLGWQAS